MVTRVRARAIRRLFAVAVACGIGSGCSRHHFRERADKDVAGVLTQKNVFPDWKIDNWHVYPDSRARFSDPAGCGGPDHPLFPPDDFAASILSPNPQKPNKKYGTGRYEGTEYLNIIAGWDTANRGEDLGNSTNEIRQASATESVKPEVAAAAYGGAASSFQKAFQSDEKPFRLRLDQTVELALFNSREFQDRREDLYLAALPVTTERFSFAAQAMAAENVVREVTGRERVDGPGNRWRIGTDATISKLFPTGATLLFRFANQIVLDLTSPRPDIAISNLSLTALQPLLRGGGFAVTLEALTQAERTLLYAIRSYARFRKVFYVVIAGNGDYTNNPYGLQGLAANLGRAIGSNLTAPTAGYLPTVLRNGTLANERKNLAALEQILKLYRNLKEGGIVSDLQVVRVELQFLQSQSRLLDGNRQYLDLLDIFKLQLGVPTNLPLELDDGPLRPMRKQLVRYEAVYDQLRDLQAVAGKYDPTEAIPAYRARWKQLLTDSSLVRGKPFAQDYTKRMAELSKLSAEELAKQIRELQSQRLKLLDVQADRLAAGKPKPESEDRDIATFEDAIAFAKHEQSLRTYESRPWLRLIPDKQAGERANLYREAFDAGMLVALKARNQRLDEIRDEWPLLPELTVEGADLLQVPLDEASSRVAQTALTNRLDLMNARAQVVDSYRQLAVRANALQGVLNVQYDLNTATPATDNEAFAFAGSRTRHALTIRGEPPFVRRVERNNYRAALISFQRQRRTLMAFEDNILNDCRAGLRQLRSLAETYKVQQKTVELAYAQVDNARSTLLAPPDPQARDTAGNPAALTEQLLQAQSQLLQAENALYTLWINYLNARMNLYLDLELLPLDARGIWTDDTSRTDLTPRTVPIAP